MIKQKITKVSASKLKNFLNDVDISNPQTVRLNNTSIEARAYPKSKAFIRQKIIKFSEICSDGFISEIKEELHLPLVTMKKLIDVLTIYGDEDLTVILHTDMGKIAKMNLENSKNEKTTLISGDQLHVPEFLPDAVWEKMKDKKDYLAKVNISKDEIKKINSFFAIMNSVSASKKDIQRIVSVVAVKDGLTISSTDEDTDATKRNTWSVPLLGGYDNVNMDSKNWIFNLSNISKLSSDSVLYIKEHQSNPSMKIMVIEGDVNIVNMITEKQ